MTVLRPFAVALLTLLSACSSEPDSKVSASGLTPVRVQLNWVPEPEFGGLYAAKLQGFFKAEGLAVTLIKGSAGVPAAQLAASGKVEFSVVSADQVITLRSRGAPLVATYASFQTSPRAILVHANSPHKDLKSLWMSSARVAMEPGLPDTRWLDKQYPGGSLKKVAASGGLAGFMQDKSLAQAVYIFAEPVELSLRKIPTRTFKVADSGYNPYAVVLATRDEYLAKNPEVVAKFTRALQKGWAHYLATPQPTNIEMAKLNPAMKKEAMDLSARLADPYVRGEGKLGAMTTARWQTLRAQLVELGVVQANTAPQPEDCFEWVK